MKVINHNKGNYHYCGTDSSVMYGSIFMTTKEWEAIKSYLVLRYSQSIKNDETYQRDSLIHVINWSIPKAEMNLKELFCLGVEATRLIFDAFGLPNYKEQNYSITIV